jgi:aminopeptidase-like protein
MITATSNAFQREPARAPHSSDAPSHIDGEYLFRLVSELYPFCRSLTGEGQRQTLAVLREKIDLTIQEVPSGTRVFDWTVPREWNIRDAYIKDASGRRVVDFADSNLHVMSYSAPVRRRMSLAELKPHLFTLPGHPDWIPYRTSYYREDWAFCLSHRRLLEMKDGEYDVCIDSSLGDGVMRYGELLLPGDRAEEILISCHICHPSLANDNLSGIAVAAGLARELSSARRRCTYRFLFTPGQIDSLVDRAVPHALRAAGADFQTQEFSPFGYDERQFCSPGFNLPVGCLMRTPHGCFPEYHTSADDLSFVRPEYLAESLQRCRGILRVLESDRSMINLNPKCEPQLGKRGLYGSVGGAAGGRERELALLWVLNLSDGTHSLLDIAERSKLPFETIENAAQELERHGLLEEKR